MSFLNPFLLISLIAVAVPVIVHIINLRRPQKIGYSTVLFFRELQKSTIRKLKLKRLLLLLFRVLAVTFLALALARPFLPPVFSGFASSGSAQLIGIVIDNGPSMNQIDGKGPYIEQAREIARILINQARSDDRFFITTTHGINPFTERMSAAQALMALDELEVQNKSAMVRQRVREMVTRLGDATTESPALYWITDARASQIRRMEGFEWPQEISRQRIPVLPVVVGQESTPNVAVTGIRIPTQIMSADRPITVAVDVTNFGDAPALNQFISLEIEGRMAGQREIELMPQQTETFYFEGVPGRTGDITGRALLEGDPVSFDNVRYFSVRVPSTRQVLLVSQPGVAGRASSYIRPVLDAAEQTGAQIVTVQTDPESITSVPLEDFDSIILDGLTEIPDYLHELLLRYVQDGHGLILLPGPRSSVASFNRFHAVFNAGRITGLVGDYGRFEETATLDRLVEGHPILDEIFDKREEEAINIDLPSLYYYKRLETPGGGRSQVLLRSTLNDPLLTETRAGAGRFLVFAMGADPGWSNFSINPLYAPLFYRSVLYASASEQGGMLEHVLGRPVDIVLPFNNIDVQITANESVFRPEAARTAQGVRIQYAAIDWNPGWYRISGGDHEQTLAVNQETGESDFSTLGTDELRSRLGEYVDVHSVIHSGSLSDDELLTSIQSAGFGLEIWLWFIIAALVCLLAESLISRMYKTEKMNN